jgi:predicted XRE-type DNA-binding protein
VPVSVGIPEYDRITPTECTQKVTSAANFVRCEDAMKSKLKIERGSGNVFEDLGFSRGEAENLQLRAQLMSKIRAEARDMTQAQAAKRFGVSQPRINDLLRGKIEKFRLDALVNMLAPAGLRVEMRVKKAA